MQIRQLIPKTQHIYFFFFFFAHRAFFFFLLISLPVPFRGLCTLKAHMRRAVAFLNVTSPINVTNCSRPYLISLSLTVPFSTQPPVPTAPAGVDGGPSPPSRSPSISSRVFFPPLIDYLSISKCLFSFKRLSAPATSFHSSPPSNRFCSPVVLFLSPRRLPLFIIFVVRALSPVCLR